MQSENLGDVDMSKKFEEEYKEYLNAQAPDLWNRIEAGVDAIISEEKVVPMNTGKARRGKNKKRIRYQHYRAIVSVAACLFALILIVPVYLLTRPAGKNADNAAAETPMMLTDATIQNIEVAKEESAEVTEESAPAEEPMDDVTEVEVELDETAEATIELAETTDGSSEESVAEDIADTESESGGQLAMGEADGLAGENDLVSGLSGEVPAQEDMNVTVVSEGVARDGGMLFEAVLIDSADSSGVQLFIPAASGIELLQGKTYAVTVEMATDGRYVVVAATATE